jgi:predicted dienelactone hydrolase
MGVSATTSEDGLWQPLTDPRIRAVMPSSPEGAWLYGERGLATADLPMLIIAPTQDEYTPYEVEMTFIYEHLVNSDRSMISYVDLKHMMILDSRISPQIRHFATAFFGYHLQGKQAYADYFSESFVTQFEGLAWGVYEGN